MFGRDLQKQNFLRERKTESSLPQGSLGFMISITAGISAII